MARPRHTLTLDDGSVYDVWRLIELTRRRPVRVPLARLKYSRSRGNGFSRRRYREADVRYPLLVGPGGRVYDGNHRAAKLADMGRKTALVVRLTPADLRRAKLPEQPVRNLLKWWRCCRRLGHHWLWDGDSLAGWWVRCAACGAVEEHLPGAHEVMGRDAERRMLSGRTAITEE